MRSRININLLFFAALGVVMTVWAVSTLISIDALRRPFPVTAQFAGAPGLRPDLEVAYLGVRVGKVGKVTLKSGRVDVGLDMDKGVKVPSNVSAQVLRKSAVGEPYIDLSLPSSAAAGTPARPLRAGDHIDLSRTASAVEYKEFFDSWAEMLRAVPPKDARIVVNEFAAGLDGRAASLRDLLADLNQLTGTLASHSELLDDLSNQATRAAGILADHRTQLHSGVNSLAAFTAALRASRGDLTRVLDKGPGLLAQATDLLDVARPGISCLLTAAGAPNAPLLTKANAEQLRHGLGNFPQFYRTSDDVLAKRPSGDVWLRVNNVITIAGPVAAEEYIPPAPKPTVPPVPICQGAQGKGRKQAAATPAYPSGSPGSSGPGSIEFEPSPYGLSTPISAKDTAPRNDATGRFLPLLPILLAAAVLLGATANALSAARRRRT